MAITDAQKTNLNNMCISASWGLGTFVQDTQNAMPTGDIVGTSDAQTLSNKTLTEPIIDDTDAGITITSADQTHATPVATIPDIGDAADTFVMADTTQTLTNKTLTSPTITTMLVDDGDAGLTVTSADQTNAAPTATIPDLGDAADTFVMADVSQTLTNKTLTYPVINIADDVEFVLGTTVTTAATKATMEFDETTSGIALFNMGSTSVPMVLNTNPGSGVIAHTVNIVHSAGAGDCDDCYGSYSKVAVTGDGDSGLTIVGDAPRAYVGTTAGTTVASEAYASQPWAKHEGTGAITAMSAVSSMLNVGADNFTVNTINSGHFHIQGAATVTGQFDGVMIEAYPDVTSIDSMLCLAVDTGAVVASAIRVSGALGTNFLDIATESTGVVVAAGSTLTHDPNAVTSDAYLVVKVGATNYAMPLYEI